MYDEGTIRMLVDEAGVTWWVAKDVCDILGIENASDTVGRFPEDEKGIAKTYTNGGPQKLLTINEPGVYRLIFRSNKPKAEKFKRWIFHEVLPYIRKTGRYELPQKPTLTTPIQTRSEVSEHLIRVWTLMRDNDEWLTNRQIAHRAAMVNRTARAHTARLFKLGLLERFPTFPGHVYKLAPDARDKSPEVYDQLETIAMVMNSRRPRLPAL
jgi:prophage antirepressor-like protein